MKPDRLLSEEADKNDEQDANLDARSRQCPYLDTINR